MATKDFNGNSENETIRQYDKPGDMPEHYRKEYGVTDKSIGPFFMKFIDGCAVGMFESVSDALYDSVED